MNSVHAPYSSRRPEHRCSQASNPRRAAWIPGVPPTAPITAPAPPPLPPPLTTFPCPHNNEQCSQPCSNTSEQAKELSDTAYRQPDPPSRRPTWSSNRLACSIRMNKVHKRSEFPGHPLIQILEPAHPRQNQPAPQPHDLGQHSQHNNAASRTSRRRLDPFISGRFKFYLNLLFIRYLTFMITLKKHRDLNIPFPHWPV